MLPRVLVVDDDEAALRVASEVLRSAGFDVTCAVDGGQALDVIHEALPPDLVVLDLMMPDIDGWKFIALLRKDGFGDLPIVVLTSFDACEDLPDGVPALHKPLDPAVLLDVVRSELSAEGTPPQAGRDGAP
jgi:CheY-like chemotaxis protein